MNDIEHRDYRTVRGYQNSEGAEELSPAMEDYLEMAGRLCIQHGYVRINMISTMLHVKPSSASKMIAKLQVLGYLFFDQGGLIYMTETGKRKVDYLIDRHQTIEKFLNMIGSKDALKETELIEHFLSPDTVHAIKKALLILQEQYTK